MVSEPTAPDSCSQKGRDTPNLKMSPLHIPYRTGRPERSQDYSPDVFRGALRVNAAMLWQETMPAQWPLVQRNGDRQPEPHNLTCFLSYGLRAASLSPHPALSLAHPGLPPKPLPPLSALSKALPPSPKTSAFSTRAPDPTPIHLSRLCHVLNDINCLWSGGILKR